MSTYTIHYSAPPKHKAARFASHPGGPKLRGGRPYAETGFRAPPPTARISEHGLPMETATSAAKMPDNFCYQAGDLIPASDQKTCGSCWAHALMFAIADRVSLITKGKIQTPLSIRQIMECSSYGEDVKANGCDGNDFAIAANSLVSSKKPLVCASDYPRAYDAQPTEIKVCVPSSDLQADKRYNVTLSKVVSLTEKIGSVGDETHLANIENMKQHIYNEGPIAAAIKIYKDFYNYDGLTIYEPSEEELKGEGEGYHAIEIIGWGTDPESKAQYWVCCNSWGSQWPAQHKRCAGVGFFYIRLGNNTCEIESVDVIAVSPVINNPGAAPTKRLTDFFPGDSAVCRKREVETKSDSLQVWLNPMVSNQASILWSTIIVAGVIIIALKLNKKK